NLLIGKAEGSPFCAEEITRALVEEGYLVPNGGAPRVTRPVEEIRIPGTVQEVIAARLDRLGAEAKHVVQVAAVLGRQFRAAELARVLDDEAVAVGRALASDEYRFGESLTQEVAYESLLLKQRRQLHERIGLLLESQPGDRSAERSALVAHHFARSENRPKAIEALLRAGEDAEELPSYRTAVDFYRQAWELAEAEAATDARFQPAVLDAASGLARLAVIFGWPTLAEAERAANRARELAEALGNTEMLSAVLYYLGVITVLAEGSDFGRGLALAEQGVAVADRAGLRLTVLRLSRGLAILHALDGRFDLARRATDWVLEELEPTEDGARLGDLYISARWIRENVLYLADDLDAAAESSLETYALAIRAPNRTVTAGSSGILAQILFLRGDYAEALRWADESLAVLEAIGNVSGLPGPASVALASR